MNKIFVTWLIFFLGGVKLIFAQQVILENGSLWKYYDLGNPNNINWKNLNFDESLWAEGISELGYGDGDEATVVGFGPSSSNKHITTYFRKQFSLESSRQLNCSIKIDDGTVVYLNGVEVYRNNLPSGTISFSTLALDANNENNWSNFIIPSGLTVAGTNILAVEMHQNSAFSSDMSFDFTMIGQNPPPPPPFEGIYINEVMASNNSAITDNLGNTSDWIEIFNNTNQALNLTNYYLTDDKNNLTKFRFNSPLTIPANSYKIIWASGNTAGGNNHTSWSLSADGEFVGLVEPDGSTIVDSLTYGKLKMDISYGRLFNNPDSLVYFYPSSPQAQNNATHAYLGFLEPPTFSHSSGYFANPFNLSLNSTASGSQIVYSTDGSDPTLSNIIPKTFNYVNTYPAFPGDPTGPTQSMSYRSFIYSSPILVENVDNNPNLYSNISTTFLYPDYLPGANPKLDKCKIVKFRAEKPGYIPSDILAKSYFINTRNTTLPVVSVTLSPEKYWDLSEGMAVAGNDFLYWRSGSPNESGYNGSYNYSRRDGAIGNFSVFSKNKSLLAEQQAEVKIHGGVSRVNPLKSMRFSVTGPDFQGDVFDVGKIETFQGFLLRNAGNEFTRSYLLDGAAHTIIRDLNFEKMRFNPSSVFLNGEYWGVMNMRNRVNDDYLSIKYNLPKINIEIGENDVVENTSGDYENLTAFVKTANFNDSQNFDYLKSKIDLESFIDYTITQSYFGNYDAFNNNYAYWRHKGTPTCSNCPQDGRWRWIMFDLDLSFDGSISPYQELNGGRATSYYYRFLKNNTEFKTKFINRYCDLMNSHFQYSNISNVIDSLKNIMSPEMPFHIARWKSPNSMNDWTGYVENLKAFAQTRNSTVISYSRGELGLNSTYFLTVNTSDLSKGHVKVNTIEITPSTPGIPANPTSWSGKYFSQLPIEIKAIPKVGYKFTHWIHNGNSITDSIITVVTSTDKSYTAYFEKLITSDNPTPDPYDLNNCNYVFTNWPANSSAGSFPDHLRFVYFDKEDPTLSSNVAGSTFGVYNFSSRTRITGHGTLGFSFINTTGSNFNVGYPTGKLGGAILALKTTNLDSVKISWKARTLTPGGRKYAVRLQYREGDIWPFKDFTPPIEYAGGFTNTDSTVFQLSNLPEEILNKPYVQLLWRYYFTGVGSGSRDQIAIDDITINGIKISAEIKNSVSETYGNPSKIYSTDKIMGNSAVKYSAANVILINPGFVAENGAIFEAKIGPCEN